ncbi:MAG: hypothetical protein KME42_14155 [Tildeniella nuda ZEHNDER 1965/U140]|nr:hypothetical protein [Tildeniella nuda ZEHNDER 1965/U140]
MAKSKYTPDRVQTIIDAIAQTGADRAGWQAGKISEDTFYDWVKRYSEFSESVSRAKDEYRDTCPGTLVRQARKAFADYLFGRMERVTYTKETGINARTGEPYEKEITQRVPVGVPKWAIERVLGKPLDILEAVSTLSEAGVLPRWLVQAVSDEVGNAREGITEVFAGVIPDRDNRRVRPGLSEETAAAIRAHLLGIQPTDATALPTTVDLRQ